MSDDKKDTRLIRVWEIKRRPDTDEDEDWQAPVIRLEHGPDFDRPWHEIDPPRPREVLTEKQRNDFVRRCYLCHHWTWEVFESGAPVYSACKHWKHGYLGWDHPDCLRVADSYHGKMCPKFWPVILRAPHRLALRVVCDVLSRR